MIEQKTSLDSSDVLSLHCGFPADGESYLKSINIGGWSDVTIAE